MRPSDVQCSCPPGRDSSLLTQSTARLGPPIMQFVHPDPVVRQSGSPAMRKWLLVASLSAGLLMLVARPALGQESPVRSVRDSGVSRDSAVSKSVRSGPVVNRAGVDVIHGSQNLPGRQETPTIGSGWIVLGGAVLGAFIALQATDCEGCFGTPILLVAAVGALVGALIASWIAP